jgi:hypothetical protein
LRSLNCDREPDRQSLSRRRRARGFQAHHFEAQGIFTEEVIFYELINRELLDYRARNAEYFHVSKRSVDVLRESKGNESPRLAAHDHNPYFYCKTR